MENKTGKYFKYAIGEIVLVVIGILIALQINNWNESRKLQSKELNLLRELKSNLETTLENFELDTLYNYQTIKFYKNIDRYIENDLPYHHELDSAFAALSFWSSPFPTSLAYKTLQNIGLDIIKNKTLKYNIVELYDVKLTSLTVDIDQAEWNLNQSVINPFFSKNIRRLNNISLNASRPNDFEALKKSDEFLNIISILIRQRLRGVEFYKDTMLSIKSVIEDIEIELKSRTL